MLAFTRNKMKTYQQFIAEAMEIKNLSENWSYAHDFDEMPNSEKQKYVYHVTTAARAAKIVKHGLKPRSPKGRTNYPGNKEYTHGTLS